MPSFEYVFPIFITGEVVHCPQSGPGQVRPDFADRGPEPQGLVH